MGGHDEELRMAAYSAWEQSSHNYKAAMQLYRKHPRSKECTRPDRFLKAWGAGFKDRKMFTDRKRSGRPRKLTQETVDRAAALFAAGHTQSGSHQAFTGINDALEHSTELKSIVRAAQMNPRTLLRNMVASHPELKKRTEDVKPTLSSILKAGRVTECEKLVEHSLDWFKRVFWLDAKTMHIAPTARKVWVDSTLPMPVKSDARIPRSGRDRRTLHFYAMVNWCTGPVAIKFVTGTSCLQHAQPYTVSHCPWK